MVPQPRFHQRHRQNRYADRVRGGVDLCSRFRTESSARFVETESGDVRPRVCFDRNIRRRSTKSGPADPSGAPKVLDDRIRDDQTGKLTQASLKS